MGSIRNKLKETKKKSGHNSSLVDVSLLDQYLIHFEKKWKEANKSRVGMAKDLMLFRDIGAKSKKQKRISKKLEVVF